MDAYCLFGFPVHHSWSPFIHGLFARQTAQDMQYRLQESPPGHFRHDVLEFFFDWGGRGCNVTLPHKRTAADLVNGLSPRAQRADAINTIIRRDGELFGDNTDGEGLSTDLRRNLQVRFATAPRILVLGAGGAARGALGPLLEEWSPSTLVIANRTVGRAIELARDFEDLGPVQAASFDAAGASGPYDLVINATSASLAGDVPSLAASAIGAHTVCYDMVYGVGETPFTGWARRLGARTVAQGWGMLVEQAAVAFELWRGVRPDTAPVLQALQDRAAAIAASQSPRTRS
jgi:shikimate dehydrogenase